MSDSHIFRMVTEAGIAKLSALRRAKLSEAMDRVLRTAPKTWRRIYDMGAFATIEALERRGLVQLRDDVANRGGPLTGFQWRRKPHKPRRKRETRS